VQRFCIWWIQRFSGIGISAMIFNPFIPTLFCITALLCVLMPGLRAVFLMISGLIMAYVLAPFVLPVFLIVSTMMIFVNRKQSSHHKIYFFLVLFSFLGSVFFYHKYFLWKPEFTVSLFLIGFYGLLRYFHALLEFPKLEEKYFKKKLELLCFLWNPFTLFSGPLESIQDHFTCTGAPQFKSGFLYLLRGFVEAVLGEAVYYFVCFPSDIPTKTPAFLILHGIGIFWVFHFRLAGWIHFTRGFSHLSGVAHTSINFDSPWFAGSPCRFFSRWNMSVARYLYRYFITGFTRYSIYSFSILTLLFFSIMGLFHLTGTDIYSNATWGILIGTSIGLEFFWVSLRIRYSFFRKINKMIPDFLKILATQCFIHLLFLLGSGQFSLLLQQLQ
jgi:hypothetical protein